MKQQFENSTSLKRIRDFIFGVIDVFYPPFQKFLPLKTFRYAACGGSVALLNLIVFFLSNQWLFPNEIVWEFSGFELHSYIAAFITALCISFPIGFILNRYVVFRTSTIKGRHQLFRYGIMTGVNIMLNYLLLHLFVQIFKLWPTPSQAMITVILAVLSYFAQNYFSFQEKKE